MNLRYCSVSVLDFKTRGSACFDIPLANCCMIKSGESVAVSLETSFDIPEGYCLLLFPRSSTFTKHKLMSPVSVIDSDYKREIHGLLYNFGKEDITLGAGDRLFQGMLIKLVDYELDKQLFVIDSTNRDGLGSTGV